MLMISYFFEFTYFDRIPYWKMVKFNQSSMYFIEVIHKFVVGQVAQVLESIIFIICDVQTGHMKQPPPSYSETTKLTQRIDCACHNFSIMHSSWPFCLRSVLFFITLIDSWPTSLSWRANFPTCFFCYPALSVEIICLHTFAWCRMIFS